MNPCYKPRELELRDAAAEAEVAELRRQLEATRAQTAPQRPDHATAQRLSAAEEHCRRAEEELEQVLQNLIITRLRAPHIDLHAHCINNAETKNEHLSVAHVGVADIPCIVCNI